MGRREEATAQKWEEGGVVDPKFQWRVEVASEHITHDWFSKCLNWRDMKAVRVNEVGGPEVLRIEEVAIPEPAAGQVLVKVFAFGINPVETYIRSGKAGRVPPTLPYTPGQDCAGTVEKIGAEVEGWKVGDRVFSTNTITGSYAQYALCDQYSIQKLADSVSFDQGYAHHSLQSTFFCFANDRPAFWLQRCRARPLSHCLSRFVPYRQS